MCSGVCTYTSNKEHNIHICNVTKGKEKVYRTDYELWLNTQDRTNILSN